MITAIYCKINQILLHPHPHPPPPILRTICRSKSVWQRPFRLRCHSMRSNDGGSGDRYANGEGRPQATPALIRVAVSGATELLKVLSLPNVQTERLRDAEAFENSTSSVDDVVRILKSDYENDYFVTGKALYERNLKLLVPFLSQPSIELLSIDKGEDAGKSYLGQMEAQVMRHAESWGVSSLQAIGQIFTSHFGKSDG